ncbi:MAG: hypothetical protein RL367_285 [Pseudomonadota bacterium]
MTITVAALYRFASFPEPAALQPKVLEICTVNQVKGTILLAAEGINGTIAGSDSGIAAVIDLLKNLPGCGNLDVKYSTATAPPFYRMKVRVKKEIVTMGVPGLDPARKAGTYVKAEDWNALIADPDTVIIDTRNDYEVGIGSFKGAIDPATNNFGQFPDWFRANRETLLAGKTKVAMFCTGGIRCEKATAFLKAEGVEQVYHLQGGILRYLETVPPEHSQWDGECFVFDERVSVGQGLAPGSFTLCRACRIPLGDADMASPLYEDGVSCPGCHGIRDAAQRQAYAERHKQVALARKRGLPHIGANPKSSAHRASDSPTPLVEERWDEGREL